MGKVAPQYAYGLMTSLRFNNIFDATAARSDLGFCYTIPWVEGVCKMLTWLEANNFPEKSGKDPFLDNLIAALEKAG